MQSVLKSFTKVLNPDGSHRSWTSQQFPGAPNYDFTVTMENGDIGKVSSKKPEGNFTIGKEYVYEKETDSQGRVKLKGFKSVDAVARSSFNGKPSSPGFWDQPEVVRSTTKSISMEITNSFLSKMPALIQGNVNGKNIYIIADLVYSWCYLGTTETPNVPGWSRTIIERRQSLQRSVDQIPYFHKEITNSNDVFKETLDRAEELLGWIHTPHKIHEPKPEPAGALV